MVFPNATFSRRTLLRASASACALAFAGCASRSGLPVSVATPGLRLLGETTLPHRMPFRGTTVGGLSAIDFDPQTGTWVTLSDDRSELQPARFYTLDVDVREGALSVQPRDVITLRQPDGQPYPPRHTRGDIVDPEGIRLEFLQFTPGSLIRTAKESWK